jgi:hypothetical protein
MENKSLKTMMKENFIKSCKEFIEGARVLLCIGAVAFFFIYSIPEKHLKELGVIIIANNIWQIWFLLFIGVTVIGLYVDKIVVVIYEIVMIIIRKTFR